MNCDCDKLINKLASRVILEYKWRAKDGIFCSYDQGSTYMCEFKVSVRAESPQDKQRALEHMGNLPYLQGSPEHSGDCVVVTIDHPTVSGQLNAAGWARHNLPFLNEMAPSVSMVT